MRQKHEFLEELPDSRLRKTERELVIRPIEGQATKSATGMIDKRIWQGGNKLRAIKTEPGNLWYLKLERGGLSPVLQQKFTSFSSLLKFVTPYFEKRGLQIVEVID